MGPILKERRAVRGTHLSVSSSDNILNLEPLLDRLDRIETRLSVVEASPSLESVVGAAINRSVADLRDRLHAEIREALVRFEGAIDNKVSLRISKVEAALIEQSVVITTLSQRAVDSEINLQRLITAVEKLFERADSGFRPRIVKEDDKTPRHRTPLTKL
jgi:hypothetical protein